MCGFYPHSSSSVSGALDLAYTLATLQDIFFIHASTHQAYLSAQTIFILTTTASDRLTALRLTIRQPCVFPLSATGDCPFPWTEPLLRSEDRMVPRRGRLTRILLGRSDRWPISKTRSELVFYGPPTFSYWRRGGTLYTVVSSCQVHQNASNGPK
jgi:hypothetical protein